MRRPQKCRPCIRPVARRLPSPLLFLIGVAVACLAIGCGSARSAAARAAGASGVETQRTGDAHPSISLVARRGDPLSAVAMAIAHDEGPAASMALASVIESRLHGARVDGARGEAYGSGLLVHATVRTPEEAARVVSAMARALREPLTEKDRRQPVRERLQRYGVSIWRSPAEAAAGRCAGELGFLEKEADETPGTRRLPPLPQLEAWRRAGYSSAAVAFSAVGPRPVLDAAAQALAQTASWPRKPSPNDPWPRDDVAGVAPSAGDRSLTVALRLGDPAQALATAQALGARDSELSLQLRALEPPWRAEHVAGTVRPRGACLRIDLQLEDPSAPAPTLQAAARVAAIAVNQARRAVEAAPSIPWALDQGILGATHPRAAASIAAWRALGGTRKPGPERAFVVYRGMPEAASDDHDAFADALSEALSTGGARTFETRTRLETGQGRIWLLLGSPCGTAVEAEQDAGLTAMALHSLARKGTGVEGVTVEPWISTDGIGLLAHGTPLQPGETPEAQAERIAEVLGRALVGTRLEREDTAVTRSQLQGELGGEHRAAWWLAVQALAPGHPSWLEPRGTWHSITAHSTHSAEAQRRAFLRGPLRLAVLASSSPDQSESASTVLERWLRPLDRRPQKCPVTTPPVPRPGEYVVESDEPDGSPPAIVATPIRPSPLRGVPREADLTLHLLNRSGGWLDRALAHPGLAASAEAHVLGGRDAAALLVEIGTHPDKAAAAIAQVRALFTRLAEGAATASDLHVAGAYFRALEPRLALDPRRRIVEVFRGVDSSKEPTLESLRRFHRAALAPERHVVVQARVRD